MRGAECRRSGAPTEPIDERSYPDWSMGFREISTEESQSVPGFNAYLTGTGTTRPPGGNRAEVFHHAFRTFLP